MKPPMAAWIITERKRLGLKPQGLADRLAAINRFVTEATVKVWEANGNRRPDPYNIEGLEQIFGKSAPGREVAADQSTQIAALVKMNTDLMSAIGLLVGRIDKLTTEQGDGIKELARSIGALAGLEPTEILVPKPDGSPPDEAPPESHDRPRPPAVHRQQRKPQAGGPRPSWAQPAAVGTRAS